MSSGAEVDHNQPNPQIYEEDVAQCDSDEEYELTFIADEENGEIEKPQRVYNDFYMRKKEWNSIILILARGPRSTRTQDFWTKIIEKSIPTIFMTCLFDDGQYRYCGQYIPKPHETWRMCGIYKVERIGPIVSLGVCFSRQSLLVYRTDVDRPFKHKVLHFQLTKSGEEDRTIIAAASRQPNPRVLRHGSWFDGIPL